MIKVLMAILISLTLCFSQDNLKCTTSLYQYDSYEIGDDTVLVGYYIQTHQFYFTDSSVVYTLINETDTVVYEKLFDTYSKKDWNKLLKEFRNIDIEDIKLVFVNSKLIGFDIKGDLYSFVYIKPDVVSVLKQPMISDRIQICMPKENTYKVYTIQGKLLYTGSNLESIKNIDFNKYGSGIFIINITGLNFNENYMLKK